MAPFLLYHTPLYANERNAAVMLALTEPPRSLTATEWHAREIGTRPPGHGELPLPWRMPHAMLSRDLQSQIIHTLLANEKFMRPDQVAVLRAYDDILASWATESHLYRGGCRT